MSLAVKALKKLTRNPRFIFEIAHYLKNDLQSALGVHRYPHKVIFIAGLPKSGTTWAETQLAKIPGYNIRPLYDPRGLAVDHDIGDETFEWLPKRGYSIVKLHTRYTPDNFQVILRHVPKFVVIIRDLRDMCVSAYFHVKSEPSHRHYELYNNVSKDEGMMHRIQVTCEHYVPWVGDWYDVAMAQPDRILLLRYEEFNADPARSFGQILDFFELAGHDSLVEEMAASRLRKEEDIARSLDGMVGLRMRNTARKGIVGDWRNHFNEQHVAEFKRLSGDVLVRMGYEATQDWN